MAGFVEKYYPDAVIWTGFPANYMLGEAFQHYVSKPLKVKNCTEYKEGERVDLIVFHPFSPEEIVCLEIINKLNLTPPLISFERNGKWMQIYKK